MSSRAASSPRPKGIPTTVTRAMMASRGRPKNSPSPSPIEGPIRVRPASRTVEAPRPISQMSSSPTTRVEIETASHQASLPAQPNPSQLVLVCSRSEEHTSELQSHRDLHSFPTRRSSDQPDEQQPDDQGGDRDGQPPGQLAGPAEPLPVGVGL